MSQRTLVIVAIVAVIIFGYLWWNYTPSTPPVSGVSSDVLSKLDQFRALNSVQIDTSILQDPIFQSLSPTPQIPPPPTNVGKPNPFVSL